MRPSGIFRLRMSNVVSSRATGGGPLFMLRKDHRHSFLDHTVVQLAGSIKASDRAFGTITGTRNLYGAWYGCTLSQGSGFGKLRPTSHWCFLRPHKSMAPVLAITDMVESPSRRQP